jgi:cellulose synthase/poly-beta-1,6-N-acetylglucosamine synthase-like glycosyltransferase
MLSVVSKSQPTISQELSEWPSVDVIVSAYNEASCIRERINNLLEQEYPGQLRILAGSDGSTDATNEILQSFTDERVHAYCFTENRGKVTVLNDLVSKAESDILVFTDANTEFSPNTIEVLVRGFSPSVGAVCGELDLYDNEDSQNQDGLYWRYEQFLKRKESSIGALLGANGANYAIKKELYQELPVDTVVDDFCIVMNVKKQGYDVIYEENAQAREEVAPSLEDEIGRRVRIGLGNYRAFMSNMWALSPFKGLFSWCYWSHKVLRWFAPHLLFAALILNIMLLPSLLYGVILVLQVLFYTIAIYATKKINAKKPVSGVASAISFFVMMNYALGLGFIRFLSGNKHGAWKRTARTGESN